MANRGYISVPCHYKHQAERKHFKDDCEWFDSTGMTYMAQCKDFELETMMHKDADCGRWIPVSEDVPAAYYESRSCDPIDTLKPFDGNNDHVIDLNELESMIKSINPWFTQCDSEVSPEQFERQFRDIEKHIDEMWRRNDASSEGIVDLKKLYFGPEWIRMELILVIN
jgi:hypothetical protein